MMSKSALERLEETGQGDSAMAQMARTGMTISTIKIVVGVIFFVVVLIVGLVMYSNAKAEQDKLRNQFPQPIGALHPHLRAVALPATSTGAPSAPRWVDAPLFSL